MARNGNFNFFFLKESPFSNWYPATFTVKGITFCCVEPFMMYCKARLFGDLITVAKIMGTLDPSRHKALGREVRGFNQEVWDANIEKYVFIGCYEKFNQNPESKRLLLDTNGTILVEASPYDLIWGACLSETDPRILDQTRWRGRNRLGFILVQVRERLSWGS